LEVLGISYTLFGVSSIETKHSSAIAGWHSVKYHLQYACVLSFEGTTLQEGREEIGGGITATKGEDYAISEVDHFGLKVSINHSCVEEIEQELPF